MPTDPPPGLFAVPVPGRLPRSGTSCWSAPLPGEGGRCCG